MNSKSTCLLVIVLLSLYAANTYAQTLEGSASPTEPTVTKSKASEEEPSKIREEKPDIPDRRMHPPNRRMIDLNLKKRAARLGTWFEALADDAKKGRVWSGVLACVGGALFTAIGVGFGLADQRDRTIDDMNDADAVFLSGAYILSGTVTTTYGAYVLFTPSLEEDRWQRWQETSRKAIDSKTLSKFEGELRSNAIRARRDRFNAAMLDLGLALGGVATVSIATYAARNHDEYNFAYLFGGLMATLGSVSAIVRFMTESDVEKAWKRYNDGFSYQDEEEVELTVQPVSLYGGVGLLFSTAY